MENFNSRIDPEVQDLASREPLVPTPPQIQWESVEWSSNNF